MLKVSYNKEMGEDGYIFDQKIRIDRNLAKNFNKYIENTKNNINNNYSKNHIMNYRDLKILNNLNILYKDYNYLNLTQLHYFMYYLSYYEHKNIRRIFNNRNTIIEII